MKYKILIIGLYPAPYRMDLFEKFSEKFDIDVFFVNSGGDGRNKKWFSKGGYNTLESEEGLKAFKGIDLKSYSAVAFYEYSTPFAVKLMIKCQIKKIPYIINCDGIMLSEHGNVFKDVLKRFLIKGAKGFLASGENAKNYFKKYGAKEDRIFIHNFSGLEKDDILESPILKDEKTKIRQKLGLPTGSKIAIAVGRFIALKRYNEFIRAWKNMPGDCYLLLIGGGEEEATYRKTAADLKLSNVIIEPFHEKEELFEYYKASDIFVHPTSYDVWGLVINEAMACGLPVVVSDRCVAGLELVKDGYNGYAVPMGDDILMCRRACELLKNEDLYNVCSKNSLKTIEKYTVSNMAKAHMEAFDKIIGKSALQTRVLIVNSVCGIRGTGRICTGLAEKFEREGAQVKIAYGRADVPEKSKKYAYRIGSRMSVGLHGLMTRFFDNHGIGSRAATKRFLKWAEDYKPDLLWLHNIHGYYINYKLLFSWIKKHPEMQVRWTLHDCWAFTGHCAYFSNASCEKWKSGCSNCPQKYKYPKSLIRDSSRENYRRKREAFTGVSNMTLITPSDWLKELVLQSFLKDYDIKVCKNAIDASVFKPTPSDFRKRYKLEGKQIVLGVANEWDERKGFSDFLKLSEMLPESFAIVMVGFQKNELKKLPSRIIGIERTDSAKTLAEIYTAADVFVNTTYEDNYPTVNLEAEACGTRVITYDTGGCRETVKREDSAVIPKDPGLLAEILIKGNKQ